MPYKNIGLKIEQIYNDYKKLIFSIAYIKVKDYHAAEDITQETIRKIIENPCKIKTLEGNELRNYVAKIAANTTSDYLKKINKNNASISYIEDLMEQDITDNFNIEDFVIARDSVERIKAEIRKLDNKYRDPLILHNLDKHTIAEISNFLGVSERIVRYRINKAIQILNKANNDD